MDGITAIDVCVIYPIIWRNDNRPINRTRESVAILSKNGDAKYRHVDGQIATPSQASAILCGMAMSAWQKRMARDCPDNGAESLGIGARLGST